MKHRLIGISLVWFVVAFMAPASAQKSPGNRILLFPLEGEKAHSEAVTKAIKANLKQSSKLVVTELRPDLPSLKRAVLEKRIAKSDIDSKEIASRLRVGQAIDADYVLYGDARGDNSAMTANLYAAQVKSGRQYAFTSTVKTEQAVGRSTLILSVASTVTSQFFQEVLGIVPPATPAIVPSLDANTKPPPEVKNTPPVKPDPKAPDVVPPPAPNPATPTTKEPAVAEAPVAPPLQPGKETADPKPAPPPPPSNTESIAYSTQAEALAAQSDYAGAIQAMKTAVNLSPADVELRLKLVGYYRKKGMSSEADAELQRALALKPDTNVSKALFAANLQSAGSNQEAIKLYRDILKENPKDTKSRLALGDALWNDGKVDDAALEYAQASNEAPSDPVPFERLARLFASRAQFLESTTSIASIKQLKGQEDDRPVDVGLYRSLIQSTDIAYTKSRSQLEEAAKSYGSGKMTRESYFNKVKGLLTEVEQLADFLTDLDPPPDYSKSYLHRTLAASLLSQSITTAQEWLIKNNAALKQQSDQFAKDSVVEMDTAAALDRQMKTGR